MSQIDCVLLSLKLTLPGLGIIVSLIFPFHTILIIANVISSSDPSAPALFSHSFRIHQMSHAMVEKRVRLDQVDNVKPVVFAGFGVGDPEVVPLGVSSSVIVWL